MFGLTSIIILSYNLLEYTKMCIKSIQANTLPPYELILVDNGSTDGTVKYLQSIAKAKLITNQINLGFSRGVNQGIKVAKGDYILLLNNDTIVAKNWLWNQLRCLNSNFKIGIVGPRSNYAGGEQGGITGDFSNVDKIMGFSRDFNQTNPHKWFETYVIVGFCMLFKRGLIAEIGLFDEEFLYGMGEDNDYCQRVLKKGYKLYCAGDTFVYHFGSQTFKGNNLDMNQIFNENKKRFFEKWK